MKIFGKCIDIRDYHYNILFQYIGKMPYMYELIFSIPWLLESVCRCQHERLGDQFFIFQKFKHAFFHKFKN